MGMTFTGQDHYDLLIKFIEWYRKTEHESEDGIFTYDSSDEIVQQFLGEETDERQIK